MTSVDAKEQNVHRSSLAELAAAPWSIGFLIHLKSI